MIRVKKKKKIDQQHYKNAFGGLINRLDKTEERISMLEDSSKEISNNKKAKRRKNTKKQNPRLSKN